MIGWNSGVWGMFRMRYTCARSLLVEVFVVGGKRVTATNAAFPPGHEKTAAVAHELGEGGSDGEQADNETAIANG